MPKFRGILAVIVLSLVSCEGDISLVYQWTDMMVTNAENTSLFPEAADLETLEASIYSIKVNLETEIISEDGRYYDTETPPSNLTPVDSISIVSVADFNADYPAGTNLAPLFQVLIGNYFKAFPADGSEEWYFTKVYSDDFYDSPMVEEVDLLLMVEPDNSAEHIFTVEWHMVDGGMFADETEPILLN